MSLQRICMGKISSTPSFSGYFLKSCVKHIEGHNWLDRAPNARIHYSAFVAIPWHTDWHQEKISSISTSIPLPMNKKIQETYLQSEIKLISRAARNYIPFNVNAVNYAKNVFYYICIVQIYLLSIFPLWMTLFLLKLISFHWINQYFSQQEKKS